MKKIQYGDKVMLVEETDWKRLLLWYDLFFLIYTFFFSINFQFNLGFCIYANFFV
jgi:hypothetical protein